MEQGGYHGAADALKTTDARKRYFASTTADRARASKNGLQSWHWIGPSALGAIPDATRLALHRNGPPKQ